MTFISLYNILYLHYSILVAVRRFDYYIKNSAALPNVPEGTDAKAGEIPSTSVKYGPEYVSVIRIESIRICIRVF